MVFAQNDPHDVEVAMKYVLLGNLSPEYASKQSERVRKAKAKLDKLGIKIESIHYTQGYYDFVDIVDAPTPEAMLAFSVWYSTQRLGRIQSMPAFDAKSFETAIKDAAGCARGGSQLCFVVTAIDGRALEKSITSSASASSEMGWSRPSASAVVTPNTTAVASTDPPTGR